MTPVYDQDGFLLGFLEDGHVHGEGASSVGDILIGLAMLAMVLL
jgi:hypothetical protein